MRIAGLGLYPGDSCYDPNRSWYVPNWWTNEVECNCIEAEGRPLGQQCASHTGFTGLVTTMGSEAGGVVGGVVGGVSSGIGTGIGTGIGQTFEVGGLTGTLVIGAAVLGAILLLKK